MLAQMYYSPYCLAIINYSIITLCTIYISVETLGANQSLPVMMFMHGGSYGIGTAAGVSVTGHGIYDGTVLANIGPV